MTQKNILILTSSYPSFTSDIRDFPGRFLRDFCLKLSDVANITVITQSTGSDAIGEYYDKNIKIIRFKWNGNHIPLSNLHPIKDFYKISSVLWQGHKTINKYLKNNKVDFIFAAWTVPAGLWAYQINKKFDIPYGIWALGSDIWGYGQIPILKNIISAILKRANIIYADGYKLIEEIKKLSKKDANFLSTTRILPSNSKVELRLTKDKINFTFIGRYHNNKGPDILLEAISLIDNKFKRKAHFHFFGDGPLKNELKTIIKLNNISDIVTLNGYADENMVVSYLKNCNALIIPSRIESIPVILSDALQLNCQIIVTDTGDMGQLVRQYNAGIVANVNDPSDLSNKISNFIMDFEDKYSKGRQQLYNLFDIDNNIEKLLKYLSD